MWCHIRCQQFLWLLLWQQKISITWIVPIIEKMADMVGHILSSPEIDVIEKRAEEEQMRFFKRYKDIFAIIPEQC